MEKVVFLFRRKHGMDREAYFEHYLGVHAPLGLRLMEGLSGYTVNLVESAGDVDAITEIWTPAVADFCGVGNAKRSENIDEIAKDHISFMGPQDAFAVDERILRDGALTSPLRTVTPGVKAISLYRKGEAVPEPHAAAYRVVDNVVIKAIYLKDRPVDRTPGLSSDLAVIRTSWFRSADEVRALPPGTTTVREFRNRIRD